MRVFIGCALLAVGLLSADVSAQEEKEPKARVERKQAAPKEEVKVYTNADLEKYKAQPEDAGAETKPTAEPETKGVGKKPAGTADPIQWLQQRRATQEEQAKSLAEAETAVTAAKEKVAQLERQLLATRNPFSARPELSEDEKSKRQEGGESAAQRHDRTKQMLDKAREDLRKAEGELARLRAGRP